MSFATKPNSSRRFFSSSVSCWFRRLRRTLKSRLATWLLLFVARPRTPVFLYTMIIFFVRLLIRLPKCHLFDIQTEIWIEKRIVVIEVWVVVLQRMLVIPGRGILI